MKRVRTLATQLPIRIKLAAIFAGVMAVVLVGTGVFLYLKFEDELDTSIDQALSSRAIAAAVLAERGSHGALVAELGREEGFGELVSSNGEVLASTPDVGGRQLIPSRFLARAARGEVFFELKHLSGISKHARLLARPLRAQHAIVVAGTTLKDRERANESLVRALLIGVPLALLLASVAGYGLAAGALHPVERMRSRAATISAAEPDARLPLPEARDEIRRLGETLNAMLARLQAAFARERAFVSDASHELRTPLAILRTELELALRGERSVGELSAAVRSAAEEVDRLSRLSEDLLVLARADEGRLPVRAALQPVGPLIRDAAAGFSAQAIRQGREIRVEGGEALEAPVDNIRIRQALGNLLDNALRHGAGAVHVFAARSDGSVELHVTDEGPGFPRDFLPHAFERFTRSDHARARGGSGLGLAIVDAIARAHGGSVHARNTADGSDVWLAVPLQSRRDSGNANQSPPNTSAPPTPSTSVAAPE
ncbi:MAG: ATP-binding protein [Thermoleophilaceae bacterium]